LIYSDLKRYVAGGYEPCLAGSQVDVSRAYPAAAESDAAADEAGQIKIELLRTTPAAAYVTLC
jgi:hypothetical protein